MTFEGFEAAVSEMGDLFSKAKLRENKARLRELNLVTKQLKIPEEYPNTKKTREYYDKIKGILDSKTEKYV
jgi:hypothetical protein